MTGVLNLCQEVYAAAARQGFLQACVWLPSSGASAKTAMVDLQTHDERLLNQLTLSAETTMSYPAGALPGLQQNEVVEVGGLRYQVREILSVSDGSELRAKLTQL